MSSLGNLLLALLLPAALILGAAFFAVKPEFLPVAVLPLLGWLPYVFAATGGLLAWHFKRSRSVFLMFTIALVFWLLCDYLPGAVSMGHADGIMAYALLLLLVPCNIFVFSVCDDRGVLTGWGILHMCFLLAQAIAVCFVMFGGVGFLTPLQAEWMNYYISQVVFFSILPGGREIFAPFSEVTALIFLLAGGVLLYRYKKSRDIMQGGLFCVLLCTGAGLYAVQTTPASLFFSAAVLIATLTLFRESYSMAFVDELTELPSRRALNVDFKKLGRKYTIAMADVDHFKKFNDTYGHDVGDDVLRMVAGQLARVTGGGTAYRYGGEEFTIIFPRATASEVEEHLNLVRSNIEQTHFRIRGPLPKGVKAKKGSDPSIVQVTISMGVAERSDKATTPEAVIKAADEALYKAKKAGRNRVAVGK